jgi:hypothetical protein
VLVDFLPQFLTSHAIFNHHKYVKHVDCIISCKFLSFFICDITFQGTLPTPHTLRPNTYNRYFKVNLTKVGFGNGGHYSSTITNLFHLLNVLTWMWLTTFWSFRFYMAMASPKMLTFILTWSWHWGPLLKVKGFLRLAFFTIKPCTSFKCLVNNHFTTYVTMQCANFTFPFWPNLCPFFFLPSHIGWTKGCRWLKGLISFNFRT